MHAEIKTLTKDNVTEYLEPILEIDAGTPGEKWTETNFLYDLPEKWKLSSLMLIENTVAGFLIASNKNYSLHIHRLAISNVYQHKGLGRQLIEVLKKNAEERNVKWITLKVAKSNSAAIRFYVKFGFIVKKEEGLNYWMELQTD